MRLYVSLKFNDEWRRVLTGVAEQCGMSVDEYCKRAIMLTTKQGLEEGLKQNAQHTTVDVPEAVSQPALPVPDSNSPVLSEA